MADGTGSADWAQWTIYITNDNCPDYTWGFTEEQTRRAMAEIVAAHLDEMRRTDQQPPASQSRYNMAVTQEALCFLERYPDRRGELIQRTREGRLYLSPYLCNTLWGFQSVEGALRAFYPALRLEREWGVRTDVAEHIELPSLPWGMASLLAGCGIRWLSIPFLAYDSTFAELHNPPLFILEGPDGERVRVIMDSRASHQASYAQGSKLLQEPGLIESDWLPHYRQLGAEYPLKAVLASGTHSDLNPDSGQQARGFSEAIARYNASAGPHALLVNAVLPQFCRVVDEAQQRSPFLAVVRGCFGHSWDVWPVSLAKYVADLREGERQFLSAEALIATLSRATPGLADSTRLQRERGEWCWAMLGDHAWNGTNEENRHHNADLRRAWGAELRSISEALLAQAWAAAGATPSDGRVTIFNPLSLPRADLVCVEARPGMGRVTDASGPLDTQVVAEDGRYLLCFVAAAIPAYGFRSVQLQPDAHSAARTALRAGSSDLDGPYYSLTLDPGTGGISSLIHKPTGAELVVRGGSHTLGQTVYFDGEEHTLSQVKVGLAGLGPVLARLRVTGLVKDIRVTTSATLYAALDRVDLDTRVEKPVTTVEERLCHVFPVLRAQDQLRTETPAAVVIPRPQPEGDLLPGADTRRFAVQSFVDISRPEGAGLRIAPREAFALRLDLGDLMFEALGNDQNYREVARDQHRATSFRFRYSICGYAGSYDQAAAVAWSRAATTPLLVMPATLPAEGLSVPVVVDPGRAFATCLKPADDRRGIIVRLWETSGRAGALEVGVRGYARAVCTDLLERDLEELEITGGAVKLEMRAFGLAGLRLIP